MTVQKRKAILDKLEAKFNIQYLTEVGYGFDADGYSFHQYVGVIEGDGVLIQIEDDYYVSCGNEKKDYYEGFMKDA